MTPQNIDHIENRSEPPEHQDSIDWHEVSDNWIKWVDASMMCRRARDAYIGAFVATQHIVRARETICEAGTEVGSAEFWAQDVALMAPERELADITRAKRREYELAAFEKYEADVYLACNTCFDEAVLASECEQLPGQSGETIYVRCSGCTVEATERRRAEMMECRENATRDADPEHLTKRVYFKAGDILPTDIPVAEPN